jgi:phenylalanyl-tRNA synthetase beta chain
MIVSWNWLADYVLLDMPVDRLTERLALTGLNHESTEETGGDLAIDLEVTSNRPDCLSHIGVAREIGVLFGKELRSPDPRPREAGPRVETATSVVDEEPTLCPRFTARVVTGIKIGESPWWMRKRLETLGVRPISNVVDITNYVMFECGQPLHAYDLDKLSERRLVVRKARGKETLRAINDKVYELTPDMLVIADAERPVGLAGVMGGLETEISAGTKSVLIEAAQFDSMSVRRTARALGLFSPSSYRFERPLDPERTEWANRRCAELILELAGGTLLEGVIDVHTPPAPRTAITLRLDQIPRVLGISVARSEVIRILHALGLEAVGEADNALTFRPPSWRADLEREVDLIEEVARIHGYHHIPEDRPVPLTRSSKGPRERVETEVRGVLAGIGFDEAATFSLVSDELIVPSNDPGALPPIRVEHSSRKKENLLRTSLIPSLLAARAYNEAHGTPDAELFEIANVYLPRSDRPLPDEPTRLTLVSGRDFLGLKGALEGLLGRLHADHALEAKPHESPMFVAGRAAKLSLGGTALGVVGEVAQERLDAFGLRNRCSAAEIAFDVLQDRAELIPRYRPLPPFPVVSRDLSLVVDRTLPWSELASAVRSAAGGILESLEYLDVFAGGDIPEGRHSLHFGLRFRHAERTLTGDEVDKAVTAAIDACAARFGATLRA